MHTCCEGGRVVVSLRSGGGELGRTTCQGEGCGGAVEDCVGDLHRVWCVMGGGGVLVLVGYLEAGGRGAGDAGGREVQLWGCGDVVRDARRHQEKLTGAGLCGMHKITARLVPAR